MAGADANVEVVDAPGAAPGVPHHAANCLWLLWLLLLSWSDLLLLLLLLLVLELQQSLQPLTHLVQ